MDPDLYSEEDELCAELEDSLEDLEDGLDVLMILEKAYQKTLQSHVCRPEEASSSGSGSSRSPSPSDSIPDRAPSASLSPSHPLSALSEGSAAGARVPLREGSSTALVAILEHPSARAKSVDTSLFSPQPSANKQGQPEISTDGAVIRIAHLGDCMGMLIRGEEIVWRTEEMWWNVSSLLTSSLSSLSGWI